MPRPAKILISPTAFRMRRFRCKLERELSGNRCPWETITARR